MSQQCSKEEQICKWHDIIEKAKKGECEEFYPHEWIRYHNTLSKLHQPTLENIEKFSGVWLYGEPGAGKSKGAREKYPIFYEKLKNKWWDNYNYEEVVLIDDLDHSNKLMGSFLKRYADHYPFRCEIKGSSMMIRPQTIVVTSNYTIREIWGDDGQLCLALERRFKEIKVIEGQPIEF